MTNDTTPAPIGADALRPIITWLDNGCDPKQAAEELRLLVQRADALASAAQPAAPASEAPEGWRNKFAEAVYADLEAADNQDVPLEEYPARILKVLDSIVGPRHPTVIHWRNDAIQACIAIAYKYCRDPESFQYLKQDLQALIFAAPKEAAAPAAVAQPVKWWNGCDKTVPAALRYLADNERPSGGEERFNCAHLYQLADEIERMARLPLYTAPVPAAQGAGHA